MADPKPASEFTPPIRLWHLLRKGAAALDEHVEFLVAAATVADARMLAAKEAAGSEWPRAVPQTKERLKRLLPSRSRIWLNGTMTICRPLAVPAEPRVIIAHFHSA